MSGQLFRELLVVGLISSGPHAGDDSEVYLVARKVYKVSVHQPLLLLLSPSLSGHCV